MKITIKRILVYLRSLINLSEAMDYENARISIRKNIAFRGPNVIVLACAIIIASVGLNVNSISVIIGAMLISPVMGPILGFGLGLGTQDDGLVRNSLKNFAVMVGISIIASSIFFILSPLSLTNPSELLARTRPTIYDVLVALFGGFAGIIETSRKEKGTVISGVAIATALMPPLCTIGYGISKLNWAYILGASYLFLINSIFIALATFVTVKYFRYPLVETTGEKKRLPKNVMYLILILVIVPSVFSAIRVVKENKFDSHAEKLVAKFKNTGKSFVYDYKTHHSTKSPTLELFMAGEVLSDETKEYFYRDAEDLGITRSQIIFNEGATSVRKDLSEAEILKGIYEHNDRQIRILNDSITKLTATLSDYKSKEIPAEAVSTELFAQYPDITEVSLSSGSSIRSEDGTTTAQIFAFIATEKPMTAEVRNRIERWLKVRLKNENVIVVNQIEKTE